MQSLDLERKLSYCCKEMKCSRTDPNRVTFFGVFTAMTLKPDVVVWKTLLFANQRYVKAKLNTPNKKV